MAPKWLPSETNVICLLTLPDTGLDPLSHSQSQSLTCTHSHSIT